MLARAMAPVLASLIILAGLAVFAWIISYRVRPLLFGRKDVRWDDPAERTERLLVYGLGQKRMPSKPERPAGMAHIWIFVAFLVAQLGTLSSFGLAYDPGFHLPFLSHETSLGQGYLFTKDVIDLLGTVGVVVFLYYRLVQKKERMTLSWEGVFILCMIAGVLWTDVFIDAALLAKSAGEVPWYLPVSGRVAQWFLYGMSPQAAANAMTVGVLVHIAIVMSFLNFLPMGKHFHIITGLPTVFFQRLTPMGQLSKLDLENSEKFGVSRLTDLSWKEILDTYSCTECGRCQTYCPTYETGKPLTHKEVNRAIRHHAQQMAEKMPLPLAQLARALNRIRPVTGGHANGHDGHGNGHGGQGNGRAEPTLQLPPEMIEQMPPLVGEGGVLPDETIWACTTCGWCEQACPVFIEHLPRIVDMRRNLVLMESRFPEEAARVFKGMETQGNPWGMGSNRRAEWCADLDIPVAAAMDPAALKEIEYLFFVGCAGSFDDRQKRVSRALVKILRAAKVTFCILAGERIPLPGAGAAERGDAEALRDQEDHHPVSALLQHVGHRVPAVRRPLQGPAPLGGDRAAGGRREAAPGRGPAGRAGHLPRQLLPGAAQRDHRGAAASAGLAGDRGAGDGSQPDGDVLLRRGGRTDVAGGDRRPADQPEPGRRSGEDPGRQGHHRHQLPVLPDDDQGRHR